LLTRVIVPVMSGWHGMLSDLLFLMHALALVSQGMKNAVPPLETAVFSSPNNSPPNIQ